MKNPMSRAGIHFYLFYCEINKCNGKGFLGNNPAVSIYG
jgi:hypothetical protein